MTENEDKESSSRENIPKLYDLNFLSWSMRIKAYLRSKGLLNYCTDVSNDTLTGAAQTNAE